MIASTAAAGHRPIEWPPPLANREERRACAKRKHDGAIKSGYCVQCGTKVTK